MMKSKKKGLLKKAANKYLDLVEGGLNMVKGKMADKAEENRVYNEEYRKYKLIALKKQAKYDALHPEKAKKSTIREIGERMQQFQQENNSFKPQSTESPSLSSKPFSINQEALEKALMGDFKIKKPKKKDYW